MAQQDKVELDILEFSYSEMESLPLFFKQISYNKMIHIKDEMILMKDSSSIQSSRIRNGDPQRLICKTFTSEPIRKDNEL